MSGDRQTENFNTVDQASRAAQAEPDERPEDQPQSEEDIIAGMREQLRQLEESERAHLAELAAEKRRTSEERSRREQAEALAREADSRAASATSIGQRSVAEARLGEITTALDARKGQLESLKSQYQAAFAEGDGGKMADINSQMAVVGAQIVTLEGGKSQLEQRQTHTPEPAPDRPSPQQVRDQMMQGLNARERDWVNSHPEYFDNPSFQKRVQAASLYAQEVKGMARDSQEYIDSINDALGFSERAPAPPPPPPREERQSTPRDSGRTADASDRRMIAAPAGGSVPNVTRAESEPVYLSREEKATARSLGIPETEYAKHKRDLLQEGLIGPGAASRR